MTGQQPSEEAHRPPASDAILIGRISGAFGTRGWIRVRSYTRPRENVFAYSPWLLRAGETWLAYALRDHRTQGSGLIAQLAGVDDRDAAQGLVGSDLAIRPEQLEPAGAGEYYWIELLGMEVRDLAGQVLGRVARLYETGAHDVLLVRGPRDHLIPFVRGVYVMHVDCVARRITVDWRPEEELINARCTDFP